MGICSSGFGKDLPDSWLELFYVLTFSTGNIRRLCDIFHKLEADESGSVHIVKLLKVLNVESNCFTEQVFTMFDSDGSGKSDFREFVLNLWDFCTISPASLDSFTFNLYDRSQMGYLTCGEISQMLKDIHGKNHVKDGRVKL